jgi:hypothetical protein
MTRIATDAERKQFAINARLRASHDRLLAALKLLYREVQESGNADSSDYGWPKAVAATKEAISTAAVDATQD